MKNEANVDDYFDPKIPANHKIAAREAGVLEIAQHDLDNTWPVTGYAVIRDGYRLTLRLNAVRWPMVRRWK